MPRLILDTTVLIDQLRDHAGAVALLQDVADREDELWSVTATRTELLAGMRRGEERATYALLEQLAWLEVTVELADAAGLLAQRFRRSHPGIEVVDYLLAAATDALGGRLLTTNVRHFPMFPGLEPAYPARP